MMKNPKKLDAETVARRRAEIARRWEAVQEEMMELRKRCTHSWLGMEGMECTVCGVRRAALEATPCERRAAHQGRVVALAMGRAGTSPTLAEMKEWIGERWSFRTTRDKDSSEWFAEINLDIVETRTVAGHGPSEGAAFAMALLAAVEIAGTQGRSASRAQRKPNEL